MICFQNYYKFTHTLKLYLIVGVQSAWLVREGCVGVFGPVTQVLAILEVLEDLGEVIQPSLCQQANSIDQASNRPSSKGLVDMSAQSTKDFGD